LTSFFDTNVLIYAVGPDPHFADLAWAPLERGGVISAQVLNEFVAVSRAKMKRSWPEIRSALDDFLSLDLTVVPLTVLSHAAAVEIASRHDIHIYDATIVACALEAGCDTLWTEDLTDGQRFGGLTVRNPFATA
jgi:predicted nucleic acid-binding protein